MLKPHDSSNRLLQIRNNLVSSRNLERNGLFKEFDKSGFVKGVHNYKWDGVTFYDPSKPKYPLWIADMDFPTPDFINEALQERAKIPNYGYTKTSDEYFQAIISWYERNHDVMLKRGEIVRMSTKTLTALTILLHTFSQEGDGVVLLTPIYHAFFAILNENKRKIIESPLIYKDGTFLIDYGDLEGKILKNKPAILLFCNPHNPVGRVWSRRELELCQEIAQRYGLLFISDEVFSDLVFEGFQHYCAAVDGPFKDNTIVLGSLGKSFNLNGIPTGFVIVRNPILYEKIQKTAAKYAFFTEEGDVFSEIATIAGYSEAGRQWLYWIKQYIYENYLMMTDFFKKNIPKIIVSVLEGSFLVTCNFEALGIEEDEFLKKCAEKNIIVNPGSKLHSSQRIFRINIACSRILLASALEEMKGILAKKIEK